MQVRWLDEEHMRCRAEDESKVQAMAEGVREELSAQLEALRAQVGEAAVPVGEPGAMTSFRQTALKVEALGGAVERLCAYMESLKVKEVAAAADGRARELEERLAKGAAEGAGRAQKAVEGLTARVDELEVALQKEQESSLKALQAILHSHSAGR